MLYAIDANETRIRAEPKLGGRCPICRNELVARCGRINISHWSHKKRLDCDQWFEPETPWHLAWKEVVVPEKVEVVIKPHRADIVAMKGVVIELQHSAISPDEIAERERFYKKMIWVIDASKFSANFVLNDKHDHSTFRWKWPKRSWAFATCPVFLDLGDENMFEIKKLYPSSPEKFVETFNAEGNFAGGYIESRTPCAGWGHRISKIDFILRFLRDRLRD